MICAPITLFVYNRPGHTRRTIDALKQNKLAQESDLVIFSDAPKTEVQADKIREVRQYIRQIDGFKSVSIVERASNLGLANSIIDGVTSIVNKYGRIIVLEDDMVTSPYFLTYMNEALERYANDDRVVSIHGYMFPIERSLPEAFFLLGADCWGWATWSRGWSCFVSDGQFLLDELKRRNLISSFDYNGTYPFAKMLEGQIKGENDSWAVRWHASAFLANKLTLHPGQSLVHNIGNDNSGTHCGLSTEMDVKLSSTPINFENVPVESSRKGRKEFEKFFRELQTSRLKRAGSRVKAWLKLIR